MARRRRLLRGVDASIDLLAEITGRAPATIRRAQSQGPSKRLAHDLDFLARVLSPKRRKPVSRQPVSHKLVPRKPLRKLVPRKPLRKLVPRKPLRKPVPRKLVPRKPLRKPVSRKPPHKPVPRKPPHKPVPRKPLRKLVPRKPLRKPVLRKLVPRKPVLRKPVPRKPLRKPVSRKPALRKPVPRKPPRKRPRGFGRVEPVKVKYPVFMRQAATAEILILEKLERLQFALDSLEGGFGSQTLGITVKSMVNRDGTVDGELRVSALPDKWRTVDGMPDLMATLSNACRAMGAFPTKPFGAFWVSFGLRFGPKNRHEIEEMARFYKRFRGLFQVGAHHATAQSLAAILTNALTVKYLVERVWDRRDLPPAQLLVRFVWTPDGKRPGRFAGEEGLKE